VNYWRHRVLAPSGSQRKSGSGRPRMTSVTDRVIVRSFLKDRFLSAVEIKSDLKVALKIHPQNGVD